MRSIASRLIDASSRIAVCGQPPVSTPMMRSAVERAGDGQQALVFLGVDVVGDDDQVPAVAHRLAQHLDQRRLARADRAADADAQRRQLLGAVGDVSAGLMASSDQERNRREYWVSCCADRMASIGVKAWRSSSRERRAPRRPRPGSARPGAASMRWPALWPERHGLERGLHHVLGPAEGEGEQRRRAPARRCATPASAKATGQVGAGCQRRERARGAASARLAVAQPLAPASGPSARSAGAARAVSRVCEHPGVQRGDARRGRRGARPRRRWATTAQVAARQARCSWSSSQARGAGLVARRRPRSTAASRPSE